MVVGGGEMKVIGKGRELWGSKVMEDFESVLDIGKDYMPMEVYEVKRHVFPKADDLRDFGSGVLNRNEGSEE